MISVAILALPLILGLYFCVVFVWFALRRISRHGIRVKVCYECGGGPCKRSLIENTMIEIEDAAFSFDFGGGVVDRIVEALQHTFHKLYCNDDQCMPWWYVRRSWAYVFRPEK